MRATSVVFAIALAIASLSPIAANAATYSNGTGTGTFVASITLKANCTISGTALNFGAAVGVLTTAVNATNTLTVTCTNTTPYNIGLDNGTAAGSTTTTRLMAGVTTPAATVPFTMSQDSGHATNWGNTQGTDTLAGTGNGSAQSLTVYGQIPAQAFTPVPQSYTTTITATAYF